MRGRPRPRAPRRRGPSPARGRGRRGSRDGRRHARTPPDQPSPPTIVADRRLADADEDISRAVAPWVRRPPALLGTIADGSAYSAQSSCSSGTPTARVLLD